MESIVIRCKNCNTEIVGRTGKTVSCGCDNIATIRDNCNISANDLTKIVMINSLQTNKKKNYLTNEDIAWQESRRKRNVRKLDFEIR